MVSFVATPIGNLGDITYRAVETLKNADEIYCEDTRHTIRLLNAYEIRKPLYACHKFNERQAAEKIAAAALSGKNVAVVSDAGMPVVSRSRQHRVRGAERKGRALYGDSGCQRGALRADFIGLARR